MFRSCSPRHFAAGFSVNKIRMLDKATIEIDDVKSAVGSSGEVYGMKPWISRGQEFLVCFSTARNERNTLAFQYPAMDQAQQRFAHESITSIFFAQSATPENREAGERVEVPDRFVVEGERGRGEWVDSTGVARFQDVAERFSRSQ